MKGETHLFWIRLSDIEGQIPAYSVFCHKKIMGESILNPPKVRLLLTGPCTLN